MQFLFGLGPNDIMLWHEVEGRWIPKGFEPTDRPQNGDIVLYFREKNPQMTQVGLYLGNATVLSKFGEGEIYQHHIKMIPLSYGEVVKFAKRVNKS